MRSCINIYTGIRTFDIQPQKHLTQSSPTAWHEASDRKEYGEGVYTRNRLGTCRWMRAIAQKTVLLAQKSVHVAPATYL